MRAARRRSLGLAVAVAALASACAAAPALGAFPYTRAGGNPRDYTDLYLTSADPAPNDLSGDGNTFKLAATAEGGNTLVNNDPVELGGVRGAHLADADRGVAQGIHFTLGRPDVTIAVLDSGIQWNDGGAMSELRRKVRLNRRELPVPNHAGPSLDPGQSCASFVNQYDANGDAVFNVLDYACDSRVNLSDPRRVGPPDLLVPQDVIIAFSNLADGDGNGFVDDIAGWDFLDDDNDAFDDVQYGHGTGEAKDSGAEANNSGEGGDQLGTCPNCMTLPLRVGDSFIADVNRFAQATLYATDNGVQVVQEALGTLNNSTLARDAVEYAYRHGVTVIASAADEAAQHNNWPSSLPHVILVNSVTTSVLPPPNRSYLAFNGCTNFNAKITLAIPSTSCSSNATGLASGMAGLIYSAAYTAFQKGALGAFPSSSLCSLASASAVSGTRCVITPSEVRQLMASGTVGGAPQSDDVNFAGTKLGPVYNPDTQPSCSPLAAPGCTDPNGALQAQVNVNRTSLLPLPQALFQSYPAGIGHDQFYGYGRVNMVKALSAILSDPANPAPSQVPPLVEIDSPQWYQQVDPARASLTVSGQVAARLAAGQTFTCQVYAAPGHYPNGRFTTDAPPGDFEPVGNGVCNGITPHSGPLDGVLSTLDLNELRSGFPPETRGTGFVGREPGGSAQTSNGRPNTDPYGFVVRVIARTTRPGPGGVTMTGEDQRAAFLHRDQDMLPGFPRSIARASITQGTPNGDGESSPALADLDGDNRNELVVAGSNGFVHAIRRDGSELPGWPVRGDRPPLHAGGRAFRSGEVSANLGGAIVGSVAVADVNRDGIPEVFANDLEGKVYGWRANGARFFTREANPSFSGKPLAPFVNSRHGELNRTQHGFIGSPVLANLDGIGQMEVIAAGMDRHLYAWHMDGTQVGGFPVLVVDPAKVQSIDPQTHQVTFRSDAGSFQQGAIIDTPAVADLDSDGRPEIVVGTNEEYDASGSNDGGFNAALGSEGNLLTQAQNAVNELKSQCGSPCAPLDVPIKPANSRLYAIHPDGHAHAGGPYLPGWPVRVGILNGELLPVVGEGITGYPVVARASCGPSGAGGSGPKIGVISNNGAGYVFAPDGESCFGQDPGSEDVVLQTDGAYAQPDHPFLPAVGHPAFADLGAGMTMLAPAAGLARALDVGLPEYQRTGQDFLAAWSLGGGGQLEPNFPQPVNDLQFLTGPSVADLDGNPGQEIVEGTASKDLAAFDALGAPLNQRWPKLTTDWTVANPTIGSFGTLDTAADARKVVLGLTRSGYINAYATGGPACSPSEWPRFHHDNANSGDHSRDATLPGRVTGASMSGGSLTFTAPGDDLLCGTATSYEIITSNRRITESNFGSATALANPPSPTSPGGSQSYALPAHQRYVAVRAVDEQGNVGRVASVDTGPRG